MRGSVKKEGRTWCYTVDIGKTPDGRRIKKKKRGFKTQKEAQNSLNEVLNDINKGKFIQDAKYTYCDFLDIWLKQIEHSVASSTFSTYSSIVSNYLKPVIGHYLIENLNIRLLNNFKTELHDRKLSNNSISKIISVLKNSLNYAVEQEYLSVNPASKNKKPPEILKTTIEWTEDDIRRFLDVAKGTVYYPAYLLGIFCGLRRGEILGITWNEIDFTKKKLVVLKVLITDGKTIIMKPKTKGSRRNVDISTEILMELNRIKNEQEKKDHISREHNLVVPNEIGTTVNPRNLLRNMKILIKKAEVPNITFHDLRHIHASLLLQQNIHMKVVSERLGHTKISTTMDRYSHLIPSLQSEAAESLNYLWGK
ncbi:site-specific integrase [Peribacillus butanolivorans]